MFACATVGKRRCELITNSFPWVHLKAVGIAETNIFQNPNGEGLVKSVETSGEAFAGLPANVIYHLMSHTKKCGNCFFNKNASARFPGLNSFLEEIPRVA